SIEAFGGVGESLLLPRNPSKASSKHLMLFSYVFSKHPTPILMQHYHYTTTLANRLQDTGALINRLSSDNVALQVEVGQPKEEKKEMEARAIKLSSQLA
ncbi:hypothetical protein BHE74_00009845, partial [Ensete ventricosum]